MSPARPAIAIRNTEPRDFDTIVRLSRAVYPGAPPWTPAQLQEHLDAFPEGQIVATLADTDEVVGMAASLILPDEAHRQDRTYLEVIGGSGFSRHDDSGSVLYGAEVMVFPHMQGRGVGKRLYLARRAIARRRGLSKIRAGARLRGYSARGRGMTPHEYVHAVLRGKLTDPTLSFQLQRGFRVIGVSPDHFDDDPECGGHAAQIELRVPPARTPAAFALAASLF
jgi:ribosomal protein S18 acetylase RimI-like enzyme